jgi:hypothetical protein
MGTSETAVPSTTVQYNFVVLIVVLIPELVALHAEHAQAIPTYVHHYALIQYERPSKSGIRMH